MATRYPYRAAVIVPGFRRPMSMDPSELVTTKMSSTEFFGALFDRAPFGICVVDSDLRLIAVNKQAAKVFRGIDMLIGRDLENVLEMIRPELFGARAIEYFRDTLRTGETFQGPIVSPAERSNGEQIKAYHWQLQRILLPDDSYGVACYLYDATSQNTLEDALIRSEERFRLAQRAGKVGVWDWDAATGLTYWSEAMWDFYGERPGSANPDRTYWADLLFPDDRQRVLSHLDQTLASEKNDFTDVFRIVNKKGEVLWLESIATIQRDLDNKPLRMYGVCLDITQRLLGEHKIRLSEERLRLLIDSVPALISYVGADLRYKIVNSKYSEWFGLPSESIVGKEVEEIVGRRAFREIKPKLEKALAGETTVFESLVNYKTAGARFVNVSYVPDLDDHKIVRGFYVLVNNITELRRSEELLRLTQERLQHLTASFKDHAIFSTDVDGNIDTWNPGGSNIYGYAESEIVGRPLEVLFTPDDIVHELLTRSMREARQVGRASQERWQVRKDGLVFFAGIEMAPLFSGKNLSGYALIVTDLTEKKRNESKLKQAYEEMEAAVLDRTRELAEANVALRAEIDQRKTEEGKRVELLQRLVSIQEEHRRSTARNIHDHLGQWLTALRLKIESLKEACSENPDLKARATRLQQIAEMIDSEVTFLAWEFRPDILDKYGLSGAIRAYVEEWSRHYGIRADFQRTGTTGLKPDPDSEIHLYRIMQEALNNIVKHARATHVSVILEKTGNNIVLIIEDNGIGFSSKKVKIGRGKEKSIGLTSMNERAALIGGSIEIESAPGRGSTVYARAPLRITRGRS